MACRAKPVQYRICTVTEFVDTFNRRLRRFLAYCPGHHAVANGEPLRDARGVAQLFFTPSWDLGEWDHLFVNDVNHDLSLVRVEN